MTRSREEAVGEFRRMMRWIALLAVLMVVGALVYLRFAGIWSVHAVVATILGVFISVLLGSGLFALAFFSDKTGHDDTVTRTTRRNEGEDGEE